MTTYTDYCPISMGVEVLGDRWTPLVIRELMVGASGFNEIHRGIPRVSRSLLAQRLRQLERMGLVDRRQGGRGLPGGYTLTPAGEALTPIVWAMGHWAAEWVFADPTDEDCDGLSLLWRLHQHAVPAKLPGDSYGGPRGPHRHERGRRLAQHRPLRRDLVQGRPGL